MDLGARIWAGEMNRERDINFTFLCSTKRANPMPPPFNSYQGLESETALRDILFILISCIYTILQAFGELYYQEEDIAFSCLFTFMPALSMSTGQVL